MEMEIIVNIILGQGLMCIKKKIVATQAGKLRYRIPNRYWIEYNSRRV